MSTTLPKNWCFQIVVLEKTLESPWDSKDIKPVNPKGNQPWIYIGRTDAEAEVPILWPPDSKELIHWKIPWCWQRLRAEGEEGNRGWDGWPATPTQNSRRQWGTGKPSVLQSMRSQRDLTTEQESQTKGTQESPPYSFLGGAKISSCPTVTDEENSFLSQWGELGEESEPWGKNLLRVERKGAWETVRGKLGSTDGSGLWIKPHFNLSPPRVFSSASQGIPFVLFFFLINLFILIGG